MFRLWTSFVINLILYNAIISQACLAKQQPVDLGGAMSLCPFAHRHGIVGNHTPVFNQLPNWANANPHQACQRVTDNIGNGLPSQEASLKIHNRGGLVMDHYLLNDLQAFVRKEIPQRVVHARGHGAFGTFTVTSDVAPQWTMARLFQKIGDKTRVLVRFSSVTLSNGASDTIPDPRGFALRFYTKDDGNMDFPGLTMPSFFLRDPMRFAQLNTAMKPNPVTNRRDYNMFHDIVSRRCETIGGYLRLHADNAQPGSSRAANGSAINTYTCLNKQGQRFYCKFTWESRQKDIPHMEDKRARILAGTNPGYYADDLYNAIEMKQYPCWDFNIQVLTFAEAAALPFNPFDATKLWHPKMIPTHKIGEFCLTKNPTDYFTQIEQAAFSPKLIPGIDSSPDPILQARLFAYKDAQRYRLGANFEQLAVNRPISPANSYQRDGEMRPSATSNGHGGPNYFPNTFNGPSVFDERLKQTQGEATIEGNHISRYDDGDDDNFTQPKQYLEMDVGAEERGRMIMRIANVLRKVTSAEVRDRFLTRCVDPLGLGFADGIRALVNSNDPMLTEMDDWEY